MSSMIEKTVGTALTTDTRCSAIQDQNLWELNFRARMTDPPTRRLLITDTNWASVWKRGRKQRILRDPSKPSSLPKHSAAARKFAWVMRAPFGCPVVPEV